MADELARRLDKLARAARELLERDVAQAIEANDPGRLRGALSTLDRDLAASYGDEWAEDDARTVARVQAETSGSRLWLLVAAWTGLRVFGSDVPGRHRIVTAIPPGTRAVVVPPSQRVAGVIDLAIRRVVGRVGAMRGGISEAVSREYATARAAGLAPAEIVAALRARGVTAYVDGRTYRVAPHLRQIAGDEVSRLHSELSQARSEYLGVDTYVWVSQRDDRVRQTHEEFDGETFSWADGSPEGHPGEPENCRCYAVPVEPGRRELEQRLISTW